MGLLLLVPTPARTLTDFVKRLIYSFPLFFKFSLFKLAGFLIDLDRVAERPEPPNDHGEEQELKDAHRDDFATDAVSTSYMTSTRRNDCPKARCERQNIEAKSNALRRSFRHGRVEVRVGEARIEHFIEALKDAHAYVAYAFSKTLIHF